MNDNIILYFAIGMVAVMFAFLGGRITQECPTPPDPYLLENAPNETCTLHFYNEGPNGIGMAIYNYTMSDGRGRCEHLRDRCEIQGTGKPHDIGGYWVPTTTFACKWNPSESSCECYTHLNPEDLRTVSGDTINM